jgi:hypothetical protein
VRSPTPGPSHSHRSLCACARLRLRARTHSRRDCARVQVILPIATFGTEEQKQKYLPDLGNALPRSHACTHTYPHNHTHTCTHTRTHTIAFTHTIARTHALTPSHTHPSAPPSVRPVPTTHPPHYTPCAHAHTNRSALPLAQRSMPVSTTECGSHWPHCSRGQDDRRIRPHGARRRIRPGRDAHPRKDDAERRLCAVGLEDVDQQRAGATATAMSWHGGLAVPCAESGRCDCIAFKVGHEPQPNR